MNTKPDGQHMNSETVTQKYILDTEQCIKVALYMYEEWQKAMEPPVFAVYSFPEWLIRMEARLKESI